MKKIIFIYLLFSIVCFGIETKLKETLNMGKFRIINVKDGVNPYDAVNVLQLQTMVTTAVQNAVGGTTFDSKYFGFAPVSDLVYLENNVATTLGATSIDFTDKLNFNNGIATNIHRLYFKENGFLETIPSEDVLNVGGVGRFYARDIICSNFLVLDTGAWYFTVPVIFSNAVDIINSDTGLYSAVNYGFLTNYITEYDFTTLGYATTNYVDNGISTMGQSVLDTLGEYTDDRMDILQQEMIMFSISNVSHDVYSELNTYHYYISEDGSLTNYTMMTEYGFIVSISNNISIIR